MFMNEQHSISPGPDGQPIRQRFGALGPVGLLLLIALGVWCGGCTSNYHRYRAELPPKPSDELKLRIEEARRAADSAIQAARLLRTSLQRRISTEDLQASFDRLETTAFELERRVMAARDAWKRSSESADRDGELEQLQGQATAWLGYTRTNRFAEPSIQASELETLLRARAAP
jgi:hypothetical protein